MAFDDLNDLSRRKQYVATAGQTVFHAHGHITSTTPKK